MNRQPSPHTRQTLLTTYKLLTINNKMRINQSRRIFSSGFDCFFV